MKVLQLRAAILSKRKLHLRIQPSGHPKSATVEHQTFLNMRQEDRQRIYELRHLIEKEEDHTKCRQLIKELVEILERSSEEGQGKTPS
jgi:hypothetical protein